MTRLETEITKLFKLCSQANVTLSQVDMYEQHKMLKAVKMQSKTVFTLLENMVNSTMVKDFKKDITTSNMIMKMHYTVMKALYMFSEQGIRYFDDDPRSRSSADLANRLFGVSQVDKHMSGCPLWMKNDLLFKEGIMLGMQSLHKTLLQNIVRCLNETLNNTEITHNNSEYFMNYDKCLRYYLYQAPENQRVYLDYI